MEAPLLGVYGVCFRYEDHSESFALEEISFELEAGEILTLFGPNACGKSTLLKIISGIIAPRKKTEGGQIRFRGNDLFSYSPKERAKLIAYVPPEFRVEFPLTVREAVMLGRGCYPSPSSREGVQYDRRKVEEALQLCLCWEIRNRDLHTLSGGERQRVMIARVIAQDPKIILLDESLSKMDLNHQAEMGKVLLQLAHQGKAVMLVSHDFNLATEWAKTALLMKEGRLLAKGPIHEVFVNKNIRALYPSSEISVGPSPITGVPKIFFDRIQLKENV